MACPSDSQIQKVTLVIILVIVSGNKETRRNCAKMSIQMDSQNQSRRQKSSFNSCAPVLTSVFTFKLLCSILNLCFGVQLHRKQLQNISEQVPVTPQFSSTMSACEPRLCTLKMTLGKFPFPQKVHCGSFCVVHATIKSHI